MAFRVRAMQKGELDGVLFCFQDAFSVDDPSLAVVRNSLLNDPYFHPERVRVGVLNGVIISHVVVLHRPAYFGHHIINIAGVTAVATHPAYQGQGYGSRVMQDALKLIRQQGYDLAMLTTRVPGFFLRVGFREVPKVDGFECPTSALSRMAIGAEYTIQAMDYSNDWRAIAQLYQQYSAGLTGLQVRELRFWETWPRRGTFPQGFSARLGAIGTLALHNGRVVAYLAASLSQEHTYLTVSDLAHLPGHEEAVLVLLREAAAQAAAAGVRRAVLQLGGNAPVVPRLAAAGVPLTVETGPGLLALVTNRDWLRPAGLLNVDDAIERLFRSEPPIMWQRDGY